jgi:hypothetical protein
MANLFNQQFGSRLISKDLYKSSTGSFSYKFATKEFFGIPADIIIQGVLKYWTGSSWVSGKPKKYWSGSGWIIKPMKIWNGSTWITIT